MNPTRLKYKVGLFSNFPIFQFSNLLIFLIFQFSNLPIFSQTTIDQQTYNYNTSNNQLTSISDTKLAGLSLDDIDNQNVNNYLHNANGQLTQDEAEGIVDIQWAVSGKVRKVFIDDDNDGTVDRTLSFLYDAMGFRVKKTETILATLTSPVIVSHTFYSRNASGELIALYEKATNGDLKRKEVAISIGSDKTEVDPTLVASSTTTDIYTRILANKYFELKDQLGTVRTVVNNVKEDDGTGNFKAVIKSTSDNYAFGMELPGRTFNTSDYRYGFQGYEKDNEIKGNGKSYITEARLYDPRIGRWQSPDPLEYKFPSTSTYSAMINNPINLIDFDGRAHESLSDLDNRATARTETTYTYEYDDNSENNVKRVAHYKHTESVIFDGEVVVRDADAHETWTEALEKKGFNVIEYQGQLTVFSDVDPVIPEENFVGWYDGANCRERAETQTRQVPDVIPGNNENTVNLYTAPKLGDALDGHHWKVKAQGILIPEKASEAERILVESLEAGMPVIVGVDYDSRGTSNKGTNIDHFVVVVGYEVTSQGQLAFRIYENASNSAEDGTSSFNLYYVQVDGSISGSTTFTNGKIEQIRPSTKKDKQ